MDRSERHTNYPNLLRFVSLIHYLLLVFHWNACLFHLLHHSTGFGYTKSEAGDMASPWESSQYPAPGDSVLTYLKSVYWTVLAMTTIGDLPNPKTRSEFIYVIFELVIGLITFATVLGFIANIVTNVSAARKDFQGKNNTERDLSYLVLY
jgi:cyclic nucleotide gated channel alpha 3